MKRRLRKLSLNRETVHTLGLARTGGGATAYCSHTLQCQSINCGPYGDTGPVTWQNGGTCVTCLDCSVGCATGGACTAGVITNCAC